MNMSTELVSEGLGRITLLLICFPPRFMFQFWMQLQVALSDKGLCAYDGNNDLSNVTPEGLRAQIQEGVQF